MSLTNKPFDQLEETDLQELVENQVPESKVLDYKVDLKFGDRDKREFLADITSFANTAGGHLLIGIREEGGIPIDLPGIQLDNPDAEKLKLINLIRDCTEPRIPGISINAVPLENTRYVLAIHIPKSWAAPHVASIEKHWRFYARHSSGKYQLDVPELRQAFLMSESLAEKIRRFHAERVAQVISGEGISNLSRGPKFIVHIMPSTSTSTLQQVDFSPIQNNQVHFTPPGASGFSRRYNLDGFLVYSEEQYGDKRETVSYVQLFRNGTVEAVCVDREQNDERDQAIPIAYYERILLEFICLSIQSLVQLQVVLPYSIMVAMTGVKNRQLHLGRNYYSHRNRLFDRDILQLPDILIENTDSDVGKEMRPIFDAIWNAAGWEKCFDYDEEGNWKA